MPGISIHVVDVSRGGVASGMRVELFAADSYRVGAWAAFLPNWIRCDEFSRRWHNNM